jgi:hypothetical protein
MAGRFRHGPASASVGPRLDREAAAAQDHWGQRARLTLTLAFAPSTAPLRAHRRGSRGRPDCLDAGRPAEVALIVLMGRGTRDLWF